MSDCGQKDRKSSKLQAIRRRTRAVLNRNKDSDD